MNPNWWGQWFGALNIAWQYNGQSASIFGLTTILPFAHGTVFIAISILAIVSFVLLRPTTSRTYWQLVSFFNPVANVYSLVVVFDQVDWVVIALGLSVLPLSLVAHTNAVWALIPFYLFLKDRFKPSLAKHFEAVPQPGLKEE